MKTFCILASVVGTFATELPSTRFTDPSHVSVPHPSPKITEVSLLRPVCRDLQCVRV